MMKRFRSVVVLVCAMAMMMLSAPRHLGAEAHPVGAAPAVEFSPAPATGALKGLANLDLVFKQRPSDREADRLLRVWMDAALAAYGRKTDVFATAWYSPTGKKIDEDMIDLAEGQTRSMHLLFTAKTNTVHLMTDTNWWPEKK